MKKITRPLLALFFFWTLFGWTFGQSVLANDYETLNASIMRPDPVTLMEWLQKSKEAPKTAIDADSQRKVLQTMSEGLGASANLLGQISYIPAERNQGGCGNCWNWAGTGVLEVALRAQQGVAQNRLSIQYLNSCKTDQFACCGGWLSTYANWYAQSAQKKAVAWSNSGGPFADANTDCRAGASARSCANVSTTPTNYPITAITMETVPVVAGNQAATIANIKSIIDGGRAIWFGFFLPNQTAWDSFFSFWNNQGETAIFNMSGYCGATYDQNGGGHAVVLVGYDDSGAEPYWLMLNSWGTANGMRPNGLFRIRMNMNYDCKYNFSSGLDDAFYWQTLNVQFQGTPPPPQCTYSISPQSEYVSTSGGTRTVNVTTQTGCAWTASESLSWVSLNAPSSGTGTGSFSYNVAVNSGSQRSGSITITNQTHTVIQEGTGSVSNLLKNPGFEDGLFNVDWVDTGWIIWDFPCDPGSPFCAYGGDWLAWLGGYDNAQDDIYQEVYIPATATRAGLRFMYAIGTNELPGTAYDFLKVYISNASDPYNDWEMLLSLSNLDATNGWRPSPLLRIPPAFIGKNVWIEFYGTTDSSNNTNFFIDNVVLAEFNFFYLPLILK